MTHFFARAFSFAIAVLAVCAVGSTQAQTAPAKKSAPAKAVKKAATKAAPEPEPPAPAAPEQVEAAERVFYGTYDCEFKQSIDITPSPKHASYVDVRHGKVDYLMKPVVSSTGAIRLEDVRGNTLMVQIASKSMLLNVKTAQRIVDDCVSPKQRDLIEAARLAKSVAASSAAEAAAAVSATPAIPATPATAPAVPASAAPAMTTTTPALPTR